jgi:hypothetical protein
MELVQYRVERRASVLAVTNFRVMFPERQFLSPFFDLEFMII